MTEQSPAITISHPPAALLRVVNPIFALLLRTPLGGAAAAKQLMVVKFTGRKSGRQYSIPLSAHLIDGVLYALTGATWKHNFRDGATAQVVHGGKTTTMRGQLISDPATVTDLYERCAQSYDVKTAERSMGLKFRDHKIPAREDFREVVERLHFVAIEFTAT